MRLFIYCAGGFGREILDVARRTNVQFPRWEEICFIDDASKAGKDGVLGARVVSFDELCHQYDRSTLEVVIAHGEPAIREILLRKLDAENFQLGKVVDVTAFVSPHADIGDGAVIAQYSSVGVCAKLGRNIALNTKAIVGHDISIDDNVVVSSMVNIGGASVIGGSSYLGMGAQIKQGLKIGREVIIGMGSIVQSDIPDGMIAMGNPARPIRRNEEKRALGSSNGGNRV